MSLVVPKAQNGGTSPFFVTESKQYVLKVIYIYNIVKVISRLQGYNIARVLLVFLLETIATREPSPRLRHRLR